jgi:hypothetical protein
MNRQPHENLYLHVNFRITLFVYNILVRSYTLLRAVFVSSILHILCAKLSLSILKKKKTISLSSKQ